MSANFFDAGGVLLLGVPLLRLPVYILHLLVYKDEDANGVGCKWCSLQRTIKMYHTLCKRITYWCTFECILLFVNGSTLLDVNGVGCKWCTFCRLHQMHPTLCKRISYWCTFECILLYVNGSTFWMHFGVGCKWCTFCKLHHLHPTLCKRSISFYESVLYVEPCLIIP